MMMLRRAVVVRALLWLVFSARSDLVKYLLTVYHNHSDATGGKEKSMNCRCLSIGQYWSRKSLETWLKIHFVCELILSISQVSYIKNCCKMYLTWPLYCRAHWISPTMVRGLQNGLLRWTAHERNSFSPSNQWQDIWVELTWNRRPKYLSFTLREALIYPEEFLKAAYDKMTYL